MTLPANPRLKNCIFKFKRMVFKKDENAYTPFMTLIIVSGILATVTAAIGLSPLRHALEGPGAHGALWASALLLASISLYSARRWWFIQPTTTARVFYQRLASDIATNQEAIEYYANAKELADSKEAQTILWASRDAEQKVLKLIRKRVRQQPLESQPVFRAVSTEVFRPPQDLQNAREPFASAQRALESLLRERAISDRVTSHQSKAADSLAELSRASSEVTAVQAQRAEAVKDIDRYLETMTPLASDSKEPLLRTPTPPKASA